MINSLLALFILAVVIIITLVIGKDDEYWGEQDE